MTAPSSSLPRTVVLVGNPQSGHIRGGLQRAERVLRRNGLRVLDTIPMDQLARLREALV